MIEQKTDRQTEITTLYIDSLTYLVYTYNVVTLLLNLDSRKINQRKY